MIPFSFLKNRKIDWTTGLVGAWRLDETSGAAVDSSGNRYDLTATNSPVGAAGKVGNARQFVRASSQYLTHASNSDLQTGDVDFTLACWLKFTKPPLSVNYHMVSKASGASTEFTLACGSSTKMMGFTFGSNSVLADNFGEVPDEQWIWTCVWFAASSNTLSIQVNDATPNSVTTTPPSPGSTPFNIGTLHSGAGFYNGLIDEVLFWKRLLSAGERSALYLAGAGRVFGT